MAERPNLLVIHTDQQSWWTLGAYGGTLVSTPHIDCLASEGVRFANFFANSAVCTPSRGCLLTGRYPHCHGAYTNNIPLNRDEITFAHSLRDNGYDTGYAGKWHLDGDRRPGWVHPDRAMGFTDCTYMFNRGHWKKMDDGPMADMEPAVWPYVVFTSDHGEYLGEHGLMYKNQLYETAHRVPLIMRWPAGIAGGTLCDRVVGMVDFAPTVLGLLGLSANQRTQGRDASPLLAEPTAAWPDQAFIHHAGFTRAGLFTPDYQLAYVKDHQAILFDRRNDPDQVRNLFGEPALADTLAALTQQIVAHNRTVESPAAAWLPDPTGSNN